MNNEKETKRTTRKTIFIIAMDSKDYLSRKVRITLLAVT